MAEDRYFFWFLHENYYSSPTLRSLGDRRFCRLHAERLLLSDNNQLSATFEFLLQVECTRLKEADHRTPPRRVREPKTPQVNTCPVCEVGETAALVEARRFLTEMANEAARKEFTDGPGLCSTHLWSMRVLADAGAWNFLRADALQRMRRLNEEMALYFHRLDYRFRDEERGQEQTAWRRALRFFWLG